MATDYHHDVWVTVVTEGTRTITTVSTAIVGMVCTGMKALLVVQSNLAVKPRILGKPELDSLEVVTALISIARSLCGFAYVKPHGCETMEEAVAYRDNFGAREVMVIWPDFSGYDQHHQTGLIRNPGTEPARQNR